MVEQNRKIIERTVELWNTGNLALADPIYAVDYVNHDPSRPDVIDLDSFKGFIAETRAGMPDFQVTVEDTIAEGDKVVTRWISKGTHEGTLGGFPPTGKEASWEGMTITRLESGKIVEAWWVYDMLGALQQLGIIPSTQAA